jgi:hypothetical protein
VLFTIGLALTPCVCSAQHDTLLVGVRMKLSLASEVSSKSDPHSSFAARLDQPIQVDGKVLIPAGALFEGYVEPVRARRLQRFGSVRLLFEKIRLPDGTIQSVDLSVLRMEGKSYTSDAEGTIRARRSKKRLLLQLGGGVLVAKLADDIAELASASVTKNTARFAGLGGVAAFLLLQKGADVKIPPGSAIDVVFGRPGEPLPVAMPPR